MTEQSDGPAYLLTSLDSLQKCIMKVVNDFVGNSEHRLRIFGKF